MGRRRSGIQASSMSWSRGPQSILSRLPSSFFRSLEGPRARGIAHGVDIPHAPLIPLARTHSCGHTELQRSWEIWLVTLGRKQAWWTLPAAHAHSCLILALLCCIYVPVSKAAPQRLLPHSWSKPFYCGSEIIKFFFLPVKLYLYIK